MRLYAFALFLLPLCAVAATNDLTSVLQKGLFEEEANHNLDAAAQAYQAVSAQFDKDRKLAATAIFRLGEVYRKQGKTNEAVVQYERIVREFSDQQTLATLSQQNLAGLGGAAQTRAGVAANTATVDNLQSQYALLKAQLQQARRETNLLTIAKLLDDEDLRKVVQQASTVIRTPEDQQKVFEAATARALDYAEKRLGIFQSAIAQARADQSLPTADKETSTTTDDEEKEIRRIQAMIQNSPDLINAKGSAGETPLANAAARGQLKVVRFLLDHGANLQGQARALMLATFNGHKAMVELLLERGADVNARDGTGGTALHLAAEMGFVSVAEALIKHKANLNARNSESNLDQTPLHTTVKAGHRAMAEFLVSKGANLEAQDRNGMTALSLAALFKQNEIVSKLLALGAKPDVQGVDGRTALSWAASQGSLETVKTLLAAKAEPNAGTNDLPLLWTAYNRSLGMAELLVRAGADVNLASRFSKDVQPPGSARSSIGGSFGPYLPLQIAVRQQDAPMVKLLLQFGADAMANTPEGVSLIFEAFPSVEILNSLLDAGANPNATNKNGQPILSWAVGAQHKEAVAAILAHKAEVNATGPSGVTSLRLATSHYRNKEIADLLRQHGGLEDVPDFSAIRVKRGNTALPTAVFIKDTNAFNRFTLFEVLRQCDYVGAQRVGFGGFPTPPSLPFPDFSRVRILRPVDGKPAEQKEILALVLTATNTFDCARDTWLEFGDVIDIPEREHSLGEINMGLTSAQSESLDQCLKRTVIFVIKGQSSEIKLGGTSATAFLSQVLRLPAVQSILRSSSDLARVKVKRTDPQTKQPRGVATDVDLFWRKQPTPVSEDVWLRNGDVIEVPDKP